MKYMLLIIGFHATKALNDRRARQPRGRPLRSS